MQPILHCPEKPVIGSARSARFKLLAGVASMASLAPAFRIKK